MPVARSGSGFLGTNGERVGKRMSRSMRGQKDIVLLDARRNKRAMSRSMRDETRKDVLLDARQNKVSSLDARRNRGKDVSRAKIIIIKL